MIESNNREASGFKKQLRPEILTDVKDRDDLVKARLNFVLWSVIASIIALIIIGGGFVVISGNMGAGLGVVILVIGLPIIVYIESKIWGSSNKRNVSEINFIYGKYVWIGALIATSVLMLSMMFGVMD